MKPKAQGKPDNRVGLDIGAYAVKIVEISDMPDRPALVRLGEKKIVGLSGEETSAAIKALAEEAKISTKEVSVSVSGPSIIVRFITMPKMSEEELGSAIRFEAEKFIPFNIDDCVLDFQILKKAGSAKPPDAAFSAAKTGDESDTRIDCLLVAARKEEIDSRVALAERAGLLVNAVDVDSFALTNSFLRNFTELKPEKVAALLNIGALSTNLSVVSGNGISFMRETAVGGNDFTDLISKKMGISEEAAEELKLSGMDRPDEIAGCAKSVLVTLLDDIKVSLSYHENQSGRSVDEIYISGGGSKLLGLEDAFTEAFGSRPNRWNPFGFLDTSRAGVGSGAIDKMRDSFAVAVGLALKVV
ncbi:MAG: type IV pilus assembly protein PilM [Candidatus Omnitrophota bacterium]|nr:type IV pilus assembly protein PilM [Candidatus Omnitrophota bacterium]